jgi:hypothetical protein
LRSRHPREHRHHREHDQPRVQPGTVPMPHHARRHAVWGGHNGQPPALELEQTLFQTSASGALNTPGTVIQYKLNNVGLIRGLDVLIRGTITAGAASTQNLTALGIANFLSQIDFQDFSSYHRITTPGWHLNLLESAKQRFSAWSAVTTDSPNGIVNQNPSPLNRTQIFGQQAAATIAATVSRDFQAVYRIPFARDRFDLRGAIWAKKTGASAFIFMTLNPNMFVGSAADPTLAVYQSAGADLATLSNVVVEVYQDYLDFFPKDAAGDEIVPWEDLEMAYLISNTQLTPLSQGQDNYAPFADERQFLSVSAIFDNAGTLNKGQDVSYWAVKSANLLPIFQRSSFRQFNVQRKIFHDDLPPGMYYFPFEQRPIDTLAFGNTNLVINPASVVSASAQLLLGYESFGRIGAVARAQAIPAP